MKTLGSLVFAIALSLISCNAQTKENETNNKDAISQSEPRGTWKVNKELDENGNLIQYDSIYSYSYGNINGKEMSADEIDSAMSSFHEYMRDKMPASFSRDIISPLKNDSIYAKFMERGFFENHWEDFYPEMHQQLRQMDSLHQQFFDRGN